MAEFVYEDLLPIGEDTTEYRLLTTEGVSTVEGPDGTTFLRVEPEAIRLLTETAMHDISHYLRSDHLQQVASILEDPEASDHDKFVALDLLKNANIAAGGVLPMCQDTGTAIVKGERGQRVLTQGPDEETVSRGVYDAFTRLNLRYSQNAPLTMWDEKNTGHNLPAQIEIGADTTPGHENSYKFLFMAKGGGSANKSFLYQETKAILNPERMMQFIEEKIRSIGTAACPPYHLAIVVGGTSAEYTVKTAKLASAHYLDELPTSGAMTGRGFRDLELEEKVFELTQKIGIGAQFGGKYLAHDIRVIRLPRHGASCPIGMGVSCSADRNIKGKITKDGIFLEVMDSNPSELIPEELRRPGEGTKGIEINLDNGIEAVCAELSKYPVSTRVNLKGTIIVARDIAHAKLKARLDAGEEMPEYFKNHPILYAGPAKTPEGYPCGSLGPSTANRMDPYVDEFQDHGASLVMIAKGNRSQVVTDACKKHGGFYLGTIGGVAAVLSQSSIKSIECVEYPELGMEAIWKITVEDFPAFILVDDKGNDFFQQLKPWCPNCK